MLKLLGLKPVLSHGGGPGIKKMQEKLEIPVMSNNRFLLRAVHSRNSIRGGIIPICMFLSANDAMRSNGAEIAHFNIVENGIVAHVVIIAEIAAKEFSERAEFV